MLPPGTEILKGRAAIEAFWQQAVQQLGDAKLTTIDVLAQCPAAAREIGTISLKAKGQPTQDFVRKYVVVWRKVGNDWRLATDIWTPD